MLICPLGTGSSGNSHYIESEGTRILIDAGFGVRQTARKLAKIGRTLESIDAIVLTHEHSDHIRGIRSIARRHRIPVYGTKGTLEGSHLHSTVVPVEIRNNRSFVIGDLEIHARRTSHDAVDSCCYVVESRDGTRVGVATDLGSVGIEVVRHLQDCDALFFEANHDVDMLRRGSYPWGLKRRILSPVGHLSNDDSIAALRHLLGERLQILTLIHLSKENNHESIVRDMALEMLRRSGAATQLRISLQEEPGELMEVTRTVARIVPRQQLGQLRLF
jgi:phosphoribosyl 1,2-cyclic phosphodiesterase